MFPFQIIFITAVVLTGASGLAALGLVVFGDTRNNAGQRQVARKFAEITAVGAAALVSLLALAK